MHFGLKCSPLVQMQACNALFVMLLIPIFERIVYPGLEAAGIRLTPLRKMSAGMLLTSLSFIIIGCLQVQFSCPILAFITSAHVCSHEDQNGCRSHWMLGVGHRCSGKLQHISCSRRVRSLSL